MKKVVYCYTDLMAVSIANIGGIGNRLTSMGSPSVSTVSRMSQRSVDLENEELKTESSDDYSNDDDAFEDNSGD